MTFKEYLDTTTIIWWFEKWPILKAYLAKRFKNFELLYHFEDMDDLLTAILVDNQMEINKVENICSDEIFKNKDKWGTLATNTSNTTNSGNSSNQVNYSGFDANGEFSNDSSKSETLGNSQADNKSVDELSTIITLAGTHITKIFRDIEKEIKKLFVIVYTY